MTAQHQAQPECGPALAATIGSLQKIAEYEQELTRRTARLAIEIADTDWKLAFARAVHDHADATATWIERLRELAVDYAPGPTLDQYDAGNARQRVNAYLTEVGHLRTLCQGHLEAAHVVSDEPTRRLLRNRLFLIDELKDQIRAAQIDGDGQPTVCGDLVAGVYSPPERPARDAVFSGGALPIDPMAEGVGLRRTALELMHANLTDLEFSTIEICCLFILQNPDLPWAFTTTMARQSWDEARHAQAFIDRILELGGQLGARRTNFTHWEIVQGQDLPVALTCHQLIGEWIGIDGAIWFGAFFRDHGDLETGRVFDFVARDECTHVEFGKRWIDWLVPKECDRDAVRLNAEDVRRSHGKSVDGPLTFPLNVWACEKAGYAADDTQKLVDRYQEFGSVMPKKD